MGLTSFCPCLCLRQQQKQKKTKRTIIFLTSTRQRPRKALAKPIKKTTHQIFTNAWFFLSVQLFRLFWWSSLGFRFIICGAFSFTLFASSRHPVRWLLLRCRSSGAFSRFGFFSQYFSGFKLRLWSWLFCPPFRCLCSKRRLAVRPVGLFSFPVLPRWAYPLGCLSSLFLWFGFWLVGFAGFCRRPRCPLFCLASLWCSAACLGFPYSRLYYWWWGVVYNLPKKS